MNGQQSYLLRTCCYRKRNETLRPMWQPALADPIARGGDIGRLVIRGARSMLAGLPAPRGNLLALRSLLGHFHAPALPLWRRLCPHGGEACVARGHGCENGAVEEVILSAGHELPLIDGAAAFVSRLP
jgi:hypothetical protein